MIYDANEPFPVGGSEGLRSSEDDSVTIVSAGVTLHEVLSAAKELANECISARLIDA